MSSSKPHDVRLVWAIKARLWRELFDSSWMARWHARLYRRMTDDLVERLACAALDVLASGDPTSTLRLASEDQPMRCIRSMHEARGSLWRELSSRLSDLLKPDVCTKCGRSRCRC
jgi:hypothetical protein